jgi:signal transduction histidine kinase/DNA-binding response OmpR family regulator/ligand-binding sensor domain-containing protein
MKLKAVILIALQVLTFDLCAYNLRQISNNEGLSNSAILSICQDSERFMWFGSCDGLNMYDGLHVRVYKPASDNSTSLSGNLIEGIMEAENNILWIATNHGFNRLDKKKQLIEYHKQFQGKYHWAKTVGNEVFAIHEDNFIDYYDKEQKAFIPLSFHGVSNNKISKFFIDENNVIWILPDDGRIVQAQIHFTNERIPQIEKPLIWEHNTALLHVFKEKERVYFIDQQYFLFEYNVLSGKKSLIMNLRQEIQDNGIVSTIIRDNDDYLVAFQTNGLIRLKNTPESEIKYRTERIAVYCGVFALYKDEAQDIIWIGTDGQGVYMYSRDSFSISSITFPDLPFHIQKPVRTLLIDKFNTLWMGTKGDGILAIDDFRPNDDLRTRKISHYTTSNSLLTNNTVYAFSKSVRNLIWIGGDGPGLNYYSFKEKKIKKLLSKSEENIVYVHSICEVNDSVLWLATVGSGILKIVVSGSDDNPVIESVERRVFIKDELSYNYFFSACRENDSILWFGNRGYGIQRLNLQTGLFRQVAFDKKDVATINDILSLHKDNKGNLWFGTSFGITQLIQYGQDTVIYENYNEIEGLPNNTIHGILEDDRGYLWLSTNNGIVQFDSETKNFRIYNHGNGLKVIEFSDGAYYRDEQTSNLLFGGTNGFICIAKDVFNEKKFIPSIYFNGLKIYENACNLTDFMRKKKSGEYLELKYEQNFFSISFVALDYINGQNCKYIYTLENFNDKWIENHLSNVVTFTKVPPGEYILHVKCENGIAAFPDNNVYSLKIVILPPWYLSSWAYLLYVLLSLIVCFFIWLWARLQYRSRREVMIAKMNERQKEEIYESKLRFFTNITHELCTPLTLIYGPCTRIASYPGADTFVKKYASLILKNTERLNALIQELIEFRRIETGHKSCLIEKLAVSEAAKNIADSFTEWSETKNIDYQINIAENMYWNSDKGCFTKILTNLLSNAFKYTPDKGKIEVDIRIGPDGLQMLVGNSGKGIKEEDIPFVFDRYTVLENFEKQTKKGISSRNGLGLAVCHNLVQLLNGKIDVRSIPGVLTEFKVVLPPLEAQVSEIREIHPEDMPVIPKADNEIPAVQTEDYKYIQSRSTILVIDDDPEMLWFVSEIFKDHYNVVPVENPLHIADILSQMQPRLIISDIMMPQIDGISLMKQVKADKQTAHIPFILLSARNTQEEQVEGIEAGAELYITKPFNVDYLRSVVDRLLRRQDDLKDYYNSTISSFEFMNGKYIHKEEKVFIENLTAIIDKNLTNPEFTTKELATQLGISLRHFYRRLKKITDYSPNDLIREYKLYVAEKLLITTRLSIDEIMDKTGFINRGSFYRGFSQKFGMSPGNYRKMKGDRTKN